MFKISDIRLTKMRLRIYLAFLFLLASSLLSAQNVFSLSKLDNTENLNLYTTFYIDINNSKNFQNIQKEDFKPLKKANFGVTQSAVWTQVTINNDTAKTQKIILLNLLASIDQIDVYIIKNGVLQTSYFIGDTRPLENNPMHYRLSNVPLDIDSNESLTLIARHYHPTGTSITQWQIEKQSDFFSFLSSEMVFWGIFIGMIFTLIIYNTGLFFALRATCKSQLEILLKSA